MKKGVTTSCVCLLSFSIAMPLFAADLTQEQQLGKIMYQDSSVRLENC